MTAGFQSINDSGTYQITDSSPNIQFKSKATVTMSASRYLGGTFAYGSILFYYYDVVVTSAVNPMVAISCTDYVGTQLVSISGSTWTYRIVAATAVTFTYYIFDQVLSSTSPGYGLEVYNSSGSIIFSSMSKNLNMKAYIGAFTYYTPSGNAAYYGSSTTMTSGATYAVVHGPCGNQYMSIGVSTPGKNPGDPVTYSGSAWGQYGGTKVNSNVIEHKTDAIVYYSVGGLTSDPGIGINIIIGNILIIDVTGL
jgi:hypothetical protein